jgi:dTDP-4-amino-4,6-dideoxygalactose transaminase
MGTQPTVEVPFLALAPVNRPVSADVLAELDELIESGAFVNGPQVEAFEQAFARSCGSADAVGVASGLDALRLGLIAAGVSAGDDVVVPALTFVATAEAVSQAGASLVLADVEETDFGLAPAALAAALTRRTRAVVPVHLYGQCADLRSIAELACRRDLVVVEDACQAHGARRDGLRAGTVGVAGAFSFYPAKNLGAFGDAGALVTDDARVADTVRMLREHGQRRKYDHETEGYTARLDTMQALVLLHKLPHLETWNEERRRAAAYYGERLAGVGDLRLPAVSPASEPVWHLYVTRTARPDELAGFLRERGVGTGRHYPAPLHLTRAFAHLGYPAGSFPVAEAVARECLSLPLFPGITEEQQEAVVDAVEAYYRG